jgi:hypothetical protein
MAAPLPARDSQPTAGTPSPKPTQDIKQIHLEPATPNLASSESDRVSIRNFGELRTAPENSTYPTGLGRSFFPEHLYDGAACVDGRLVSTPVDHETRYRLEIRRSASGERVDIYASVTVILLKDSLVEPVLNPKYASDPYVKCGQYLVSEIDYGGRLSFGATLEAKPGENVEISPEIPDVLEVGSSPEDVAYFGSVMNALLGLEHSGHWTGGSATISDPRPLGTTPRNYPFVPRTMDSLTTYAQELAQIQGQELKTIRGAQQYIHFSVAPGAAR